MDNSFGTYHTGFLIASLDMELEYIETYKYMASMYPSLTRFTQILLNEIEKKPELEDVKKTIESKAYQYIQPYKNAKENIATFMHEYIHYLQDITTMAGITCLKLYSNLIQEALHKLGNSPNSAINCPISTEENDKMSQMRFLLDFFTCANSKKRFKRLHHIDRTELQEEILFTLLNEENPDIFHSDLIETMHDVVVYADDGTEKYDLGASIISESMAYLFERIVFDSHERINEYPYNICEMIIDKYCPTIAKNKIIVLAICELSLMHCHSGEMFYEIINEIKKNKLTFNCVKDFEAYFCNKTRHLLDAFEESIAAIDETIDFLYPNAISTTKKINFYIKNVLKSGSHIRKKGLFIARAAENRNGNAEINFWFECLGLPLLIDQNSNIFSKIGTDLTFILAPKALESLLFEQEKECFLYNICKLQKQYTPCFNEETCSQKPWNTTHNQSSCPLATYLHHYCINSNQILK